jgi:hypothetical protein
MGGAGPRSGRRAYQPLLGGKALWCERCLRRRIGAQNIRFPRIARSDARCPIALQFRQQPAFERRRGPFVFCILEGEGASSANERAQFGRSAAVVIVKVYDTHLPLGHCRSEKGDHCVLRKPVMITEIIDRANQAAAALRVVILASDPVVVISEKLQHEIQQLQRLTGDFLRQSASPCWRECGDDPITGGGSHRRRRTLATGRRRPHRPLCKAGCAPKWPKPCSFNIATKVAAHKFVDTRYREVTPRPAEEGASFVAAPGAKNALNRRGKSLSFFFLASPPAALTIVMRRLSKINFRLELAKYCKAFLTKCREAL